MTNIFRDGKIKLLSAPDVVEEKGVDLVVRFGISSDFITSSIHSLYDDTRV